MEDVYRRNDLREEISKRFIWTLDLDKRYKVIAFLLALYRDEAEEGHEVTWIYNQCIDYWRDGFTVEQEGDEVISENSLRDLLEEMVGLGVLRYTPQRDSYSLRSPNIVALLGNEKQIENELENCSEWERPVEYMTKAFRRAVDPKNHSHRSPLTAAQENALTSVKNGVFILSGVRASGFDVVSRALRDLVAEDFLMVLDGCRDLEAFSTELSRLDRREKLGTTLFVVSDEEPWREDWVEEAARKVERLKSRKAFVKVIFLAGPAKVWKQAGRWTYSPGSVEFMSLEPWQDVALRQWLEDCQVGSFDEESRLVIRARTGNWPLLLDLLYRRCQDEGIPCESVLPRLRACLEIPVKGRWAALWLAVSP